MANTKVKPKGYVKITAKDKDGKILDIYEKHNLVVDVGRTALAELLGGLNQSDKKVTQGGFGTSDTAPLPGNTSLTTEFKKVLDGVSYPATAKVSFEYSLSTLEYNGNTIKEFGLFTFDDTLFARLTHPGIAKTSVIGLTVEWVITF